MWRRWLSWLAWGGLAIGVASCAGGPEFVAKEEPWRKEAEVACLRSGIVQASAFVSERASLDGPSVCGAIRPFVVRASLNGAVGFNPPALVQCAMVANIDQWVARVVTPAAHYYFGMGVAEMKVLSSYSCRPRNGIRGAQLSEHGFANAIDIGAFRLVDGREIKVLTGWNGSPQERAFLRAVHSGACRHFSTVLGPNANKFHRDHFHLDLARHGRNGMHRVCE